MLASSVWSPSAFSARTIVQYYSASYVVIAYLCIKIDDHHKHGHGVNAFQGRLPDGREVAVKRVAFTDGQSSFQFENEIKLIPKLRHTNIVQILGYCIRKREGILVFEYMPEGSLDCCIYGKFQLACLSTRSWELGPTKS